MPRSLLLLLGLCVATAASAQDAPMSHDGMDMDTDDATTLTIPDVPTRANNEARPSPNASVGQTVGTTDVYVQYGRPALRGRSVFAEGADLAPAGAVWRTGANEAATITVTDDVMVEGEMLPAGTYALFTIPGDDAWTVIFNRTAEQWGAFRYDEAEDQLRVTAQPMTGVPPMEQFQIRFEDVSDTEATMLLHWGTVGVPVRIAATS